MAVYNTQAGSCFALVLSQRPLLTYVPLRKTPSESVPAVHYIRPFAILLSGRLVRERVCA